MISLTNRSVFLLVASLTWCNNILRISSTPVNLAKDVNNNNSYTINRDDNNIDSFPTIEDDFDTGRIVGGRYARKYQFPFMAIIYRMLGNGSIRQCGGTIISPRWVLTAGHCVESFPKQFLVVFGVTDKTGMGYNSYKGPGVSMTTNKTIVHLGFKQSVNDIGLMYMPRDIPYADNIQPIKLTRYNYRVSFAGRFGIVIGWGKDRPDSIGTTKLKYVTLPIISNSKCKAYWPITSKHVCTAGYMQDACQGDSGGPLVIMQNGVARQLGIVSYGDFECFGNMPGVFTRISEYIDWIQAIVGHQL